MTILKVANCYFVAAGPVSRILCAAPSPRGRVGPEAAKTKSGTTVIPLGRALLRGSSDLPGSCDAPSQHARPPKRTLLPYLVLLRVGFSLPPSLLTARCALTAPFHPYPAQLAHPGHNGRRPNRSIAGDYASTSKLGGAVCFLWHFPSTTLERRRPDVIRHTALWSSDFPLPARTT